jgi:hypothetical protein
MERGKKPKISQNLFIFFFKEGQIVQKNIDSETFLDLVIDIQSKYMILIIGRKVWRNWDGRIIEYFEEIYGKNNEESKDITKYEHPVRVMQCRRIVRFLENS